MKEIIAGMLTVLTFAVPVFADKEVELAKKLANPIASLISLPIQANYDENFNADERGSIWRINVQPVIPVSFNEDLNLISRTILPIIDQNDVPAVGRGESGIGDIVQSLFFSPKLPTTNGLVWGVGPVILLPTASKSALGGEKWGLGPTAVALKQEGPWTYGALVNHIESFAGDNSRADISATFIQPFLAFVTHTKTTLSLNTESTYDWENEEWSVPINFMVSQLLKVGPQIIQVGGGVRYWADSSTAGPKDWGLRLQLTFLFPR